MAREHAEHETNGNEPVKVEITTSACDIKAYRDEDDSLEGPSRGNSPAPGIQGKANPSDSTTAGEFDVSDETRANFSQDPQEKKRHEELMSRNREVNSVGYRESTWNRIITDGKEFYDAEDNNI
ncbi:hypothetical protein V8E54_006334 [Elaphomyces granulatus]